MSLNPYKLIWATVEVVTPFYSYQCVLALKKHPKQLGSNAQNLVCVLVTPSYSEGVQKTALKTVL